MSVNSGHIDNTERSSRKDQAKSAIYRMMDEASAAAGSVSNPDALSVAIGAAWGTAAFTGISAVSAIAATTAIAVAGITSAVAGVGVEVARRSLDQHKHTASHKAAPKWGAAGRVLLGAFSVAAGITAGSFTYDALYNDAKYTVTGPEDKNCQLQTVFESTDNGNGTVYKVPEGCTLKAQP